MGTMDWKADLSMNVEILNPTQFLQPMSTTRYRELARIMVTEGHKQRHYGDAGAFAKIICQMKLSPRLRSQFFCNHTPGCICIEEMSENEVGKTSGEFLLRVLLGDLTYDLKIREILHKTPGVTDSEIAEFCAKLSRATATLGSSTTSQS